jgi:hypothetical protein
MLAPIVDLIALWDDRTGAVPGRAAGGLIGQD